MKSLTRIPHDFLKEKSFTGRFKGEHDEGFYLFLGKDKIHALVPKTKHTDLAVSQIKVNDCCLIESTATGFDVWLMTEEEAVIWETESQGKSG